MRIEATQSAQKWIEIFHEINIPTTAKECFNGIKSIEGLNAPNLAQGINACDKVVTEIKERLKSDISKLREESGDEPFVDAIGVTFSDLIEDTQVNLVTKEDELTTTIKNRNIFKYRLLGDKVPSSAVIDKEIVPENEFTLLGVYLPSSGSICIWIDRIINQEKNPELIFQKVLLHEFIHALYDIMPRLLKRSQDDGTISTCAIGNNYDSNKEESLDNTLVMHAYSHTTADITEAIRDFISKQPWPYNDAISIYDTGYGTFVKEIEAHLKSKVKSIDSSFTPQILFYVISYGENDDIPVYTPEQVLQSIKDRFSNCFDIDEKETETGILGDWLYAKFEIPIEEQLYPLILKISCKNTYLRTLYFGKRYLYKSDSRNDIESLSDLNTYSRLEGKEMRIFQDYKHAKFIYTLFTCVTEYPCIETRDMYVRDDFE